jgi:hypothetical protein
MAVPAAAALIPPIPDDPQGAFAHVLEHVIGLDTQAKRDRVTMNAGVTTAFDLLLIDMEGLVEGLTANTSGLAKMRLKTMKKWAEEEYDLNGNVDIRAFTTVVCGERQMNIARSTKVSGQQVDKSSTTKEKLAVFNGKRENWTKAKRELTAHLNQTKNEVGIPIYYVIRDPDQEERYRADNGELGRKIYEAPFRGRIYEADAFQVLQILRQWTSGGTAETFVDNNNNVQDAWTKLIMNYEGRDARGANIQKAREMIANAHWTRNTHNFNFDDYCNRHIKANHELDRYESNVDGESQVNAFLKGIRTDSRQNTHLLSIKAIVLNNENTKGNLANAVITFKDTMRQFGGTLSDRDQRNIGAVNGYRGRTGGGRGRAGGRDNRGQRGGYNARGGRGYGRGDGRGRGRFQGRGRQANNDNLFIPPDVLAAVGPRYQAMLFRGRDQMEKESKGKEEGGRVVSAVRNEEQVSQISDVTEQYHANVEEIEDQGASSQFGATGRKKRRTLGAITSTIRRIGKAMKIGKPNDYSIRARAEIDTRADTVCAGSTFLLHESTGKVVDVSGFHDSLGAIKDIQVGTCVTAVDLENETIIACFPQSLYFGDTMENSLIPPIQMWEHGITVDVVPKQYSDGRSLHGIHHPDENVFIPFSLHGCISYFPSRLPNNAELNSCRWVTFTSDAEWQPLSEHFNEAERAMKSHHRYMDPRHLHYDRHGEELDGRNIGAFTRLNNNLIENCLPNLCLYDFDEALVTYERQVMATSSNVHRSNIPIEILAKRWGTSVATATDTLQKNNSTWHSILTGSVTSAFPYSSKAIAKQIPEYNDVYRYILQRKGICKR